MIFHLIVYGPEEFIIKKPATENEKKESGPTRQKNGSGF